MGQLVNRRDCYVIIAKVGEEEILWKAYKDSSRKTEKRAKKKLLLLRNEYRDTGTKFSLQIRTEIS